MHQLGLEVFISMLVLQQRLDMLVTLTCLDDDHGFCHIVISEGRLIVLNGTINASSTTLARYNGCHERVCTSRNPLYNSIRMHSNLRSPIWLCAKLTPPRDCPDV
jgi:hypothetical protein